MNYFKLTPILCLFFLISIGLYAQKKETKIELQVTENESPEKL
jgi:hypothetical protein